MRRALACMLTVLAFTTGSLAVSAAPSRLAQGEILVKFKKGTSANQKADINRRNKSAVLENLPSLDVMRITAPRGGEIAHCGKYKGQSCVEFAEPNYFATPSEIVPNDPYYNSSQWALTKIQAPAAWDITQGSDEVTIAVVDTGVDSAHPDLAPRMIAGYDIYNNDADPSDDYGHGTKTAGVLGACANNAIGVSGVTWNCKIMPIKVSDATGYAPYSCMANGITYAADHGARVINVSMGGSSSSYTLQSAVDYAFQKGCVVVASSGNGSLGTLYYPAACRNAIAVGSTNQYDQRESYSNYGTGLALVAPGTTYTTTRGGGYASFSGTSAASPVVAGVAALVVSANQSLTAADVRGIIQNTADDVLTTGWDSYTGWGRVNAYEAVAAAGAAPVDTTPPAVAVTSPGSGTTISSTVSLTASANDNAGVSAVDFYVDGAYRGRASGAYAMAWDTTSVANGAHKVRAIAYDLSGNTGASPEVTVTVSNSTSTTQTFVGQLAVKAQANTHVVALSSSSTVSADLSWTGGGTLRLQVYNSSGALLASVASSSASIRISPTTYQPGNYTFQVSLVSGKRIKYTLTATASSP